MGKAKSKEQVKDPIISSKINHSDLSDEKKTKILSEQFMQFQNEMAELIGMQIGVRLHASESKIEAIMVPVKLQQEQVDEKASN